MFDQSVDKQIAEVVKLRDDKNYTFEKIGERLGFSERTARRRYEAAILQQTVDHLVDEELDDFPVVGPLNLDDVDLWVPEDKLPIERFKPLVREGDCMVTCDFHIPLHDPGLINAMIACARENDIKHLIIAGDYFHMETFSSYLPYQPEASLEQERYDGNLIAKTLLQTFDEIDIIWGNHDFRLSRKLGFKKSFTECMQWMLSELDEDEMSKIRFSDLDYMRYYPTDAAGRKFRICHPRNFSSVPLTVPRKLSVKYACSIITAHSHHCAIGAAANGYDLCIEGGGFFSKERTEYIQKTTNNHEWVQGFTMFKDGLPTLISPTIGNDKQYRKEGDLIGS